MRDAALTVWRQRASEASGGTSGNPIYAAFERVLAELNPIGDVLDFGAGRGNLIAILQRRGRLHSIAAADLLAPPEWLEPSVRWIACDLNEPTPFSSEQFDLVLAAEVIEHLENPRATAREWFRLLRPGGVIVLSTPNNESWRSLLALVVRGHFVAFADSQYPAHVTALVRKDLSRILQEAGFHPPKFSFTHVGGIPRIPRLSWQRMSAGLLRGLRYSDNLLAIAMKPGEPIGGTYG